MCMACAWHVQARPSGWHADNVSVHRCAGQRSTAEAAAHRAELATESEQRQTAREERARHDAEVAGLRITHSTQLSELSREHSDAMRAMQAEVDAMRAQLAAAQRAAGSEHGEAIAEVRRHADEEVAALRRELAKLDMHEGQPLRHERYGRAKERLSRAAFGLGYFDTSYESAEIRVTPSTNSAAVALVLDTGPSYSVGAISIDQHTLDDDVLRRYLPIHEGEPFAPDKLLDTQFQLMDLGYFSRVDVHPMREEAEEGRMPIRIAPEYLPSQRYSTGIGYGTDTGARLSLKTELRRINRRGHWIDSDIRLAERRSNAGISYNIPLGDVPGERLSFTGTYSDERFEDGTSERYELGVSLSRQPGSWRRRTYLEYSSERFNVGDLRRTTDLLVPGVSFERSESDDPIYPRNGWRVFFDVHGAGEPVLSSTSFAQTRVATNGILPLWDKARLLGRFEYGASFVDSFERLPLSERFYAGGDQSVRGYAYQSLGERDAEGNVIGGRYLATMSAEAEYLFWGNTGAAIFMEAGGAANKSFPELSRSVGVGVRYRSPIGSLRLDLAHPLDATRSVRLHIGIRVGL